jgi:hypothetical protein
VRAPAGTVGLGVCWTLHPLPGVAAGFAAGRNHSVSRASPARQWRRRRERKVARCGTGEVAGAAVRSENVRGSWVGPAARAIDTPIQLEYMAKTAMSASAGGWRTPPKFLHELGDDQHLLAVVGVDLQRGITQCSAGLPENLQDAQLAFAGEVA